MEKKPESLIHYDKSLPYIENRDPSKKPTQHLVKDGLNSYKVENGRRSSKMLLVNKLREEVDKWREQDYPGVTDTTKQLLLFWFDEDHLVNGELFKFWFCQKEAIETLIYLFEVKKYNDIAPVINDFAANPVKDLYGGKSVEISEDTDGKRRLIRYFAELNQEGEQDLPEKDLLRYAFKMATGSGKTFVMALVAVWSYFNRLREKNDRYSDNFLIVAPNVIVYERLAKDFENSKIFYEYPFIPKGWQGMWNVKVTLRGDDSPLVPSGNLILDNIQQLYSSRKRDSNPKSIIDEILGRKPQKNLTKSADPLSEKIKTLSNLIVMNDEAHHVHDDELMWNKTLTEIHHALPDGFTLWLDFSATPKTQSGTYFPWIIVDYPLAQAVEDRIVKSPLIVHRVNKNDPEKINKNNVIQKYGDWIVAALDRWQEHYEVYKTVGKKVVLFIMAEKNDYADAIAKMIRNQKSKLGLKNPEEEVLVIHVKSRNVEGKDTEIQIKDKDLPRLRELARNIDKSDNKVKIIVSNMMLREGWDVQNVTVILGLRPFTAKAEILPEQAVGRGLRLMRGPSIGSDHTQTLEIMGTKAFEDFVRELEKEGVGINTQKTPPPLPLTIAPEKSRLMYDIKIPQTEFRYSRNYTPIDSLDPYEIPPLFTSDKLDEDRKIQLKMEFMVTGTEVHEAAVNTGNLTSGRELVSYITTEVIRKARLTGCFSSLYPKIESYILNRCFETKINNIEDKRLRKHLNYDSAVQQAVIDLLAKQIGNLTAEEKEITVKPKPIVLSATPPFIWRRKHLRCKKTVFNFVAVYNGFEAEFAEFLDKDPDIVRFSALASIFKIDYLSTRGARRLYYPDFVAVRRVGSEENYWIIETKGREYEDTDRKEAAAKRWCADVSKQTGKHWDYIKVLQTAFDYNKYTVTSFGRLVQIIRSRNAKENNLIN